MNDQQREQKRIDELAATRERRRWLMSLSDVDSFGLAAKDRYDRIRYLGEKEAEEFVRQERIRVADRSKPIFQKD